MNYIIEEIKQYDTKFIKIPNNNYELFESFELYIIYYIFDDESNYILIKSGYQFFHDGTLILDGTVQLEIYEIAEEQGIKNICDIFYNFCNNYLSNGFTHTEDYIVYTVCYENNKYSFHYCTLEQYKQDLVMFEFDNTLTINNVNDLAKYYNTINQMEDMRIYLKLKSFK